MKPIEIFELRKVYGNPGKRGSVEALRGIDMEVEPGIIFGLLGPNGAGKTTLVKILLSIVHPTSGQAYLQGIPVEKRNARLKTGYLPEDHLFPPYLTGESVLYFYGALNLSPRARIKLKAGELLERLDMGKWMQTKVRKYSKGMLQRLGLAAALITDPEVIFLDEPTDGVDPLGRRAIRDLLLELKREGKTVFVNSHLLMEVEMVCDKVAILNRGSIIRTGSVGELTPKTLRYRVETSSDARSLKKDLLEFGKDLSFFPGGFSLELRDKKDADRFIGFLREKGVEILSFAPERLTLEDVFVHLVLVREDGP